LGMVGWWGRGQKGIGERGPLYGLHERKKPCECSAAADRYTMGSRRRELEKRHWRTGAKQEWGGAESHGSSQTLKIRRCQDCNQSMQKSMGPRTLVRPLEKPPRPRGKGPLLPRTFGTDIRRRFRTRSSEGVCTCSVAQIERRCSVYTGYWHSHCSALILLIRVPTPCETCTRNSVPSRRSLRGLFVQPTPAGVLLG
jgi:hypothetical protein